MYVAILCVYLEPVGAKAPTFSSASTSFTFKHRIGDNFGLLCQAQAFPVPLIRYFSLILFCWSGVAHSIIYVTQ